MTGGETGPGAVRRMGPRRMASACLAACAAATGLGIDPLVGQEGGPSTAVPSHPEPAWYLEVADGACRLFVQEYGRGRDTVVVLHGGWGAEHAYLLGTFADLGEAYHLVFYDQRGSLRSPCPDSLVSVAAHVEDLERLREQLGTDRLHLAAHSMGTRLALEYLVAHPERTGGLVLMGAVNPRPFDAARDSAVNAGVSDRRQAFFEREACEGVRETEGLARPDSLLSDEERSANWRIAFTCANAFHVERWRRMEGGQVFYAASAGRAAAESMDPEFDATGALRRHPCPTRVIVGAEDWVVGGGEIIRHLYEEIPGVEVRVLPETGHALWIDAPEPFADALEASLGEVVACVRAGPASGPGERRRRGRRARRDGAG